MTITITPKQDRNRHLTYAETIVDTNETGQQLCKPRYGCNWSINQPTGEGTILTHYIGEELAIKARWNATYTGKVHTHKGQHHDYLTLHQLHSI